MNRAALLAVLCVCWQPCLAVVNASMFKSAFAECFFVMRSLKGQFWGPTISIGLGLPVSVADLQVDITA